MEEIADNIKRLKEYLNLNIVCEDYKYVLQGIVFVKARFNDYSICKNYTIKIEIFKPEILLTNYYGAIPNFYVYKGIDLKYSHIYSNGLLCLDSRFIQLNYLIKNNFDYIKWFNFFFLAYAVEYEYYMEYGCSLGMERKHGKNGLLEVLLEFADVTIKNRDSLKTKIESCKSTEEIFRVMIRTLNRKVNEWELKEMIKEYFECE